MARKLEVFVATKGHAFSRDGFEDMLRAINVEPTMVDHPAAAMLLHPEAMARFDAVLLYDMPGLDFRVPVSRRPEPVEPDPALRNGFLRLLESGKGVVALHHALAGWPGWPEYGEALGGRFLYRPQDGRGASGYLPDARYTVCRAAEHPVTAGLPDRFELVDELYACERLADRDAMPLLLRDGPLDPARVLSAMHAVRRESQEGWVPPADDAVIAWVRAAGNAPLVYLQPGDGPQTYANEHYRRLLGNALHWVASAEARDWACRAAGQTGHRMPGYERG